MYNIKVLAAGCGMIASFDYDGWEWWIEAYPKKVLQGTTTYRIERRDEMNGEALHSVDHSLPSYYEMEDIVRSYINGYML